MINIFSVEAKGTGADGAFITVKDIADYRKGLLKRGRTTGYGFCWLMSALAILELAAVIVILRKMKKQQAGRVNRIIVFLTYLILFFVTIKCALFPPVSEVKTTGAYDIASEDYWLATEQKGADGNTRELQVRAWYPANYDGEEHSAKVVVCSHGSCGTIDNNVSLFKEFASHGFVVLAVAHEG